MVEEEVKERRWRKMNRMKASEQERKERPTTQFSRQNRWMGGNVHNLRHKASVKGLQLNRKILHKNVSNESEKKKFKN